MKLQKKIFEETWRQFASTDEFKELSSERVRKVLEVFARGSKFERILDVGCGDGTISIALKKVSGAKEVHGVDISEKAVELAKSKGVKAYVVDVDADQLPFANAFFDAVYAGEIIEHLVDEVHRVLKKRGIFVLTTPNFSSLVNRLLLLIGFQPLLTPASLRYSVGTVRFRKERLEKKVVKTPCGHIRSFTYYALLELLELHGFHIRNSLGCRIPWLGFPLSVIDKIGSITAFLAGNIIFECQKHNFALLYHYDQNKGRIKMERVLIADGGGFIGSQLARYLCASAIGVG